MSKNHFWKLVFAVILTTLIAGVGLVPNVAATAPNPNIVVNCVVGTVGEWQLDENMGSAGGGFGTGLYITWDTSNFYVGITPGPIGDVTIYIDNGTPGGMTTASLGGTHQIASTGGYEYSYSNVGTSTVVEVASSGSWVSSTTSGSNCIATSGTDIEWAIPWSELGVVAGTSRITVLVTSRNSVSDADRVFSYWPNVAGNVGGSTPSFSNGFIFPDPINASGYSPFPGPTALSLNQFTAYNPQDSLLLLAGILILATSVAILLYRRTRKQNI